MTQLPLNQAIPRFKENEERVDVFVNGDANTSYYTDANVAVPTVAKFLKDKGAEVNTFVQGITANVVAARDAAILAANNAAANTANAYAAKVAAETARDQALAVGLHPSDFATYAQGAKADTAVQPGDIGNMATQNSNFVTITGGQITGIVDLAVADGGTGASNSSQARTNLGIGTIGTQNANNVTITGGSISNINAIAVADGGTGAVDATGARGNLGLGSISTQNANNVTITGGSISNITDLAIADGGTGSSNAAGARTNLGLGTAAVQNTEYFAANTDLQNAVSNAATTAQNFAIAFAIALG